MGSSGRKAGLKRKTNETEVILSLNLDGSGQARISTGIGFFDHMLELFARHSGFDLECESKGDLEVDPHHSVEDVGIVLGQALNTALGEKRGIVRFSSICLPMQESLARVAVDISGRPHFTYNAELPAEKVGDFDAELVQEFLEALVVNGRFTLHVDLIRSGNTHHAIEAIFKAIARTLKEAVAAEPGGENEIPSTKGTL